LLPDVVRAIVSGSCSTVVCEQVLSFPVPMLVRFWVNHHLLDLVQRPCWRVVKGRSRSYVNKVLSGKPLRVSELC
jgi:predicted NAD/FAD-binding protein